MQIRELKGGERWALCSSNSGTCVWWENVSSSHPANIHLTPCSQSSGLRPGHKPQTPDTEESRGKWAAALPPDPHKSASDPMGAAGTQGCLFLRARGPLGTARSGCHTYRRDTGRKKGRQGFFCRKIGAQSPLPPAHFKPQAEIQEARGRESTWTSLWDTCRHEGAQAPLPQCLHHRTAGGPELWVGIPGLTSWPGSSCSRPGSRL